MAAPSVTNGARSPSWPAAVSDVPGAGTAAVVDDRSDDATQAYEVAGPPVEPVSDETAAKALRGEPEAEAEVEEGWERAKSMDGEAPTG